MMMVADIVLRINARYGKLLLFRGTYRMYKQQWHESFYTAFYTSLRG